MESPWWPTAHCAKVGEGMQIHSMHAPQLNAYVLGHVADLHLIMNGKCSISLHLNTCDVIRTCSSKKGACVRVYAS